jgi:hypothetical protein
MTVDFRLLRRRMMPIVLVVLCQTTDCSVWAVLSSDRNVSRRIRVTDNFLNSTSHDGAVMALRATWNLTKFQASKILAFLFGWMFARAIL